MMYHYPVFEDKNLTGQGGIKNKIINWGMGMKKLLFILLSGISFSANAEIISCVGAANDGVTRVVIDMETSIIHVNGNAHKYEAGTKDGNGVCTENYKNTSQKKVYLCVWIDSSKQAHLLGTYSETNKLFTDVELSCHPEN